MAIYSVQALIAEQNGFREFLAQLTLDGTPQSLALPSNIPGGYGALPSNCMLVLQADVSFNYDLGAESGAIDSTDSVLLQYYGQTINFSVGDTVTGADSGETGVIETDVDNGTSGYLILSAPSGAFDVGEIIEGSWTRLSYNTQTGNFTVGQVVTGADSTATGTIEFDIDGGTTGTLVLSGVTTPFDVGEIITDPMTGSATSGASTVAGSATAGTSTPTLNPGILVAANAQEHVRRSVNYFNPMTHILVQSTGAGTLNVFYVNLKTDVTQSGDLTVY